MILQGVLACDGEWLARAEREGEEGVAYGEIGQQSFPDGADIDRGGELNIAVFGKRGVSAALGEREPVRERKRGGYRVGGEVCQHILGYRRGKCGGDGVADAAVGCLIGSGVDHADPFAPCIEKTAARVADIERVIDAQNAVADAGRAVYGGDVQIFRDAPDDADRGGKPVAVRIADGDRALPDRVGGGEGGFLDKSVEEAGTFDAQQGEVVVKRGGDTGGGDSAVGALGTVERDADVAADAVLAGGIIDDMVVSEDVSGALFL